MAIKKLPYHLNPRQNALLRGFNNLSDIELLAIIIRHGNNNFDSLIIARKMIEKYHSFYNLQSISLGDLQKIPGIGIIKAIYIKSVFELSKRIKVKTQEAPIVKNIIDAVKIACDIIKQNKREVFLILMLNEFFKIIYYEKIFAGTRNEMVIDPKTIIKIALKVDACQFYCFHNHPSGNVKPSQADILTTNRIKNYSKIFEIKMIAHIIVNSKEEYQII